jgi:hypothetical protein
MVGSKVMILLSRYSGCVGGKAQTDVVGVEYDSMLLHGK